MRALASLLLLIPSLVAGGTFVTNNDSLFADKVDARACSNADARKCIVASDMNALKGAAYDLRTALSEKLGASQLDASIATERAYVDTQDAALRSYADGLVSSGYANVLQYGAKRDNNGTIGNGTNDYAAIQAAITAVQGSGGVVLIPPGFYRIGTQLLVTGPNYRRFTILAYGATLVPDEGVSGIRITGGNTHGGTSIYGLRIQHRNASGGTSTAGNNTAGSAFEIVAAWMTKLIDCSVAARSTNPNYAAVLIRSSNPDSEGTGSYWTRIDNMNVRNTVGETSVPPGTPTQAEITAWRDAINRQIMAYGIHAFGAANSLHVTGSTFSSCKYSIYFEPEAGTVNPYLADSALIDGNAFEAVESGISVKGVVGTVNGVANTPSTFSQHRYTNNRFEAVTNYAFNFTGTAVVQQQPFMSGNRLSTQIQYISNTMTNLAGTVLAQYTSLDLKGGSWGNPFVIQGDDNRAKSVNYGSAAWVVEGKPNSATAPSGFDVARPGDTGQPPNVVIRMGGTSASFLDAEISNPAGGGIRLTGVKAISATTTRATNFRGKATLAAGTATVTFPGGVPGQEPDANYHVVATASAAEAIGVSNKSVTGFTLTSSNAASTATVDWILVR